MCEQNLDGQVATDIDVAALEDCPHAALRDLAQQLETHRTVGHGGHLTG
jgi:hypothetical protein